MLILHHLAFSRSSRVLWLLEELGVPYDLVRYERTEQFRAPPELAAVHPLGKAPVIVDGALTLAESATILRYIHDRHGDGRLTPPAGTDDHAVHEEWLDYVESSAGLPIMLALLASRFGGLGDQMDAFLRPQVSRTLDYIAAGLGEKPLLMGQRLTLADIQMAYLIEMADRAGLLGEHGVLGVYLSRVKDLPSFRRAVAVGGPLSPPQAKGR